MVIETVSSILAYVSYLYFVYPILVAVITIRILLDNKPPEVSIAWLLAIYFLPYLGVILYLLGGVNWKKQKILKQLPEKVFQSHLGAIIEQQKLYLQDLFTKIDSDIAKTMTLALKGANSLLTLNNQVRIFHSGKELFDTFLDDLEAATHSIHLEYFIFRSDELGHRVKDILTWKAAQGVKVRLLFDGVGCFRKMSRKFKKELKAAGIETRFFLDPMNVISGRLLNYCNHRKIAIIDGEIGYTGGMNIGSEYITGGKRYESWRDTHIRITGEGVHMLQSVFISDWFNSGGRFIREEEYFPEPVSINHLPSQVVCSGPDSDWATLKKVYFNLIINADKEVYIQTPYFIPDQSIINALETAALSGVEVHFMMTGVPDKRIPFWVAQTYFESLSLAGVHIYLYEKGFFHPKVLVMDETISTVGSCNVDIRSFDINYELNMLFYDRELSKGLIEQFKKDLKYCRVISIEDYENMSFWVKLRNGFFKIVAPLL